MTKARSAPPRRARSARSVAGVGVEPGAAAGLTNFVTTPISILEAIGNPAIWAPWFRGPSWGPWHTFLAVLFGLRIAKGERELFRQCTGRKAMPVNGFTEAWLICGRRSGKSLVLATCAVFLAVFRNWGPWLAPGERGVVQVLASDRRQARVIFRYARALLREVPTLAVLIARETAESLDLHNGITIEITTANYKNVRGYTLVAALCDEIAFWSSAETGANPDSEVLAALRPTMSTIPGAVLLCASSPYGRAGALWKAYKRYHGQDDAPVLVWRAATRTMNPTVPEAVIAEAYERDPQSAGAEYGAEFRDDVAAFLPPNLIEAAIDRDVAVRPPVPGVTYTAFADPSGGVADSFAVAIAHAEDGGSIVVDVLYERRAPFNPTAVVVEIKDLLRSYGLAEVVGDRYAAKWVSEAFAAEGVAYRHAQRDRSAIYADALALFTSGRARLLDHQRLTGQLAGLERRTSPAGRDRIDHGPHGRDDVANAVCGALVLAAQQPKFIAASMPLWTTADASSGYRQAEPDFGAGHAMRPDDWSPGVGWAGSGW